MSRFFSYRLLRGKNMSVDFVLSLLFVGIFGLMLGSFLNVVIYRLPRRESIVFPGSHCPVCGVPVKYYDNIPVLGYILLKGRCRSCSASISILYPFIEMLTSLMAMGLFALNWFNYHGSFASGSFISNHFLSNFIADLALAAMLLAVFFIDLRHMIIPDRLNFAGGIIAVIMSFRWGLSGIVRGAGGAIAGLAVMVIMTLLGKLLYKRQGIGMGDMKLAVVIGLFVGPFWCLLTFVVAVFSGGMWGIIQLFSGRVKTGQEVPFGPFIAIGGFSVLFFKREILFLVDRYLLMF